jgi:hypothetical protein
MDAGSVDGATKSSRPPRRSTVSDSEVWVQASEYGVAASAWMSKTTDTLSRELHPILGSVRHERVADLPRPEDHAPETAQLSSSLFQSIEASHLVTVDVHDALQGDVDSFLTMVFELADALGAQYVKGMLEHIGSICEASGQTIDATGRDFFDVIIATLETIDISFDENGEHNLTMLLHPDTAEKLRGKRPTPEQEARVQAVLERRREEWNVSRRRHDLP